MCASCEQMLATCMCEGIPYGKGIVYAQANAPLTKNERDANFKKWVQKLTSLNSGFDASAFYKYVVGCKGKLIIYFL